MEGKSEAALNLLHRSVRSMLEEPGLMRVHLYNSASFRSDVAVSLVWSTQVPRQGSRTGLSIRETLNTFGLVEYSIWLENEVRQSEGM